MVCESAYFLMLYYFSGLDMHQEFILSCLQSVSVTVTQLTPSLPTDVKHVVTGNYKLEHIQFCIFFQCMFNLFHV